MRVVRFLTLDSALRVLSAYSTFAMQNVQYYVHLGFECGDGAIGDTQENRAAFEETRRHYELLAATLISCWTILDNGRFLAADWHLFNDRKNGIAIVSDVESVCRLIKNLAKGFLTPTEGSQPKECNSRYRWDFAHGRVIYYSRSHPQEFETMDLWKWKREEYQKQREYRFAFLASSPMMKLDSVVFYVRDPGRYIQEIHFGPEVTDADKKRLLTGTIAAELAGKIHDFDAHFNEDTKGT
jgi:hypothetical protein